MRRQESTGTHTPFARTVPIELHRIGAPVGGAARPIPGYRTLRTVKAGIKSQFEQAQQNAKAKLTWEGLVEQGYVVAGPPDKVIAKLNELATNLNVGHLMLLLQMGSMPRDVAMYNTQMFAERVAPHLRDKFNEFEDKWYPKMMPAADRANPIVQEKDQARIPVAVGGGGQ